MARIDQIRDKLEASLKDDGKPRPGYTLRVAALRRELSALELHEAARSAAGRESVGVDTPAEQP